MDPPSSQTNLIDNSGTNSEVFNSRSVQGVEGGSRVQRLIKSGPLHYLGNQALHRKPIIGHVVPYGSRIIQLTILLVSVPDLTPGLCSVCGGHRGVRIDGI